MANTSHAISKPSFHQVLDACRVVLEVATQFTTPKEKFAVNTALKANMSLVKPKVLLKAKKAISLGQLKILAPSTQAKALLESLSTVEVQSSKVFLHQQDFRFLAEIFARGISGFQVQGFFKKGQTNNQPHFVRYTIDHTDSTQSLIFIQRSNEMPWDNLRGSDREARALSQMRFFVSYGNGEWAEAFYINYYFQFADMVTLENVQIFDEKRLSQLEAAGFVSSKL